MGSEVDEVTDGDRAVKIEVADAGVADQNFIAVEPADALETCVHRSGVAHRAQSEWTARRGRSDSSSLIQAALDLVCNDGEIAGFEHQAVVFQIEHAIPVVGAAAD